MKCGALLSDFSKALCLKINSFFFLLLSLLKILSQFLRPHLKLLNAMKKMKSNQKTYKKFQMTAKNKRKVKLDKKLNEVFKFNNEPKEDQELMSPNNSDMENDKKDLIITVEDNIERSKNSNKLIIFKKTFYDQHLNLIKMKGTMPSTEEALEMFEKRNQEYFEEQNKEQNDSFLNSKKLESFLMKKLSQPIIGINKRIIKFRRKRKSFKPTVLTTIYEDVFY